MKLSLGHIVLRQCGVDAQCGLSGAGGVTDPNLFGGRFLLRRNT